MKLWIVWISFLVLGQATAAPTEHSVITISKPFPVVGYLEKRGKVITLKAGPSGTIFSIEEKNGKVLADNLSEAELLARNPKLYAFVKSALADNDETPGIFIDASVGPKPSQSGIPWKLPKSSNRGPR